LLYSKVSEKKVPKGFETKVEEKRKASALAASNLRVWSDKVTKMLEQRELKPPVAAVPRKRKTLPKPEPKKRSKRELQKKEKAVSPATRIEEEEEIDPMVYVGQRIAKYFDDVLYFGTIKEFKPSQTKKKRDLDLWFVFYDDEDQEDLDKRQLLHHLKLYGLQKGQDPFPQVADGEKEGQDAEMPPADGEKEGQDVEVPPADGEKEGQDADVPPPAEEDKAPQAMEMSPAGDGRQDAAAEAQKPPPAEIEE
jgi:hypothetical protein